MHNSWDELYCHVCCVCWYKNISMSLNIHPMKVFLFISIWPYSHTPTCLLYLWNKPKLAPTLSPPGHGKGSSRCVPRRQWTHFWDLFANQWPPGKDLAYISLRPRRVKCYQHACFLLQMYLIYMRLSMCVCAYQLLAICGLHTATTKEIPL